VTSRISWIVKRVMPVPLFTGGRKARLVPMSREDERDQAELHRRREKRRIERESRP
jgi:hypothetical protein